ncbi:MAG: hypothetical protein KF873_14500 [Gemmataceae bacterium]|nr:hypothetical protein [Gemmataceae bacterium]
MTKTKPLPSEEQIREYASKLPKVYREILGAIHKIDPFRQYRDSVNEASLWNYFYNQESVVDSRRFPFDFDDHDKPELTAHRRMKRDEFLLALQRLEDSGFIEPPAGDWSGAVRFVPTDLGEALIAQLSGREAPRVEVPELPPINW